MNNDNNDPEKNEFPTIKPADINLTRAAETDGGQEDKTAAPSSSRSSRTLTVALLILIMAVIGVVFFLPDWVEQTTASRTDVEPPAAGSGERDDSDTASDSGQSAQDSDPGTPWSDAQLSKLRKQSQDLLADMLEAEETLKQHSVEQWAGEAFEEAREMAEKGDAAYEDRQFDQAVELYRQALDRFTGLVDSMDPVYEEAVQQGQQALAGGNASKAAERFERALLIRPEDETAERGQQRAATLDEVNALIEEGDEALEEEALEQARETYSKALEIDPYADRARERLEETRARIRDRDFRQAMSKGFAALDEGRLEQAREAFAAARKLKPGSGEAEEAIKLADERITLGRINGHLQAAEQAAANEDWQTAVDEYREALSLDSNLASARNGLQRALARLRLDKRLQNAIARPERLWDEQVRRETRQLLQEAASFQSDGARLSEQIRRLRELLEQATTPVTVQLRSDNQTSVTIYKVGDMGQFEQRTVTLMPGRYVAVGTRPGYRDVRVEFTVSADRSIGPVEVAAREKINPGSG